MPSEPVLTREIAPLPERRDDAHKGDVGRLVIIGGCCDETLMVGAVALAANAAFRSGAGLVQLFVPEPIRSAAAVLAPCATTRTLPTDAPGLLDAVAAFRADVVALGPGLGKSLTPEVVAEFVASFGGPIVVDADGLNALAEAPPLAVPNSKRVILTPHSGEMRRLLAARGRSAEVGRSAAGRRKAAAELTALYGCTAVLKGRATVVTDGDRLYVNETGNAGMATGGAGDVLTGVIAGLLGQGLHPLEAGILGVYLHGLAGDFASEELGRLSMTAMDLVEYLPEAFSEHEMSASE
ncbi:MAG: NAD(P)H-hydrate dehydratase [Phycisphaerae bacterium]|jgi:NAD(P)H-hydrate epimerase